MSIVIFSPQGKCLTNLGQREEQVSVETFVTQFAVETFDVGILYRFAGPNKVLFDLTRGQ